VVEARSRRKAEAKAARRHEAEAAIARRSAAECAAVEQAVAGRSAVERALVVAAVAALEQRVAADESAALAALAAVFEEGGEDGRCALPNLGWAPEPRGGSPKAGTSYAAALGPQCRAGGRRALAGSGRRRPHVRWRARRESYYIRRPPLVLLQQCGG
jgi:hypothetical protein